MNHFHIVPSDGQQSTTLKSFLTSAALGRLLLSGIFALGVFVIGCLLISFAGRNAGYEWHWFEVVYFVLITMTTVGYAETLPGMEALYGVRAANMFIIMGGMGAMVLFASNITAFFVEGDLQNFWKGRQKLKEIDDLEAHIVLAGVGETGIHAAMEFLSNGIPFVAIDRNQDRLDRMVVLGKEAGWVPPTILGDATADEVLEIAGVRHARGVMACLSDDPANLFVVITSRELNPHTRILARMTNEGSRKKMMRAGADGLVSPNQIGGLRLASEMTRPAVVTFLDEMRRNTNRNVRIEEINLTENSPLAGKTLADSKIRETTNALVLAIRRSNRDYEYNPPTDTALQPSDTLVVLADRIEVQTVRRLCGDPTQTLTPS